MAPHSARHKIAIVNTSTDIVEMLASLFEEEGYEVVTALARDFRTQQTNVENFIAEHDPLVLVWDIAMPYEENWRYFQMVKQLPSMQGRHFILTTTNEKRVREVVGTEPAVIEVVSKPFDLRQLAEAVEHALQWLK